MRWQSAIAVASLGFSVGLVDAQQASPTPAPAPNIMSLSSSAFADGGVIPDKYTQSSSTPLSPAMTWKDAPDGVVSYTLIMHDIDNAGRRMTADTLHWMAFNIPGTATSLPEGVPTGTATLPDGTIQAKSARPTPGYLGPGAPHTVPLHHYIFELYALDTKLSLTPDATRDDVLKAMDGHVIGKAAMFGRFHR